MEKGSDKEINILYLIEKSRYLTKMSRGRFHSIKALGNIVNVIYWGPGWDNYNIELSLSDNIKELNTPISFIICYKAQKIKDISKISIPKCITYNEMYDEIATVDEINSIKPDLIICHHKNDMVNYQTNLFKNINHLSTFKHIPHCADNSIFYDKNTNRDIDILLCGVIDKKHSILQRLLRLSLIPFFCAETLMSYLYKSYNFNKRLNRNVLIVLFGHVEIVYPIRERLIKVIELIPKKYKCGIYKHPGYKKGDAHTDIYPKEFSDAINKSKICLTCTSKYRYRLAKMVEIPMCGSVLASDLPNQDEQSFDDMMIKIDIKMSNEQIAKHLVTYLENKSELERIRINGLKWSQKYVQEYYADQILAKLKELNNKNIKIFVLAEDLNNLKNKLTCDVLKDEFLEYSNLNIVHNPKDADIIWLLAPWAYRKINKIYLEKKFVISTIHHIDKTKYSKNIDYFNYIDSITNRYHTICPKSYSDLRSITKKEIIVSNFWINENNFYKIDDKESLRRKYNIPINALIIGSFQKDTEGRDKRIPKLSKGPDILINIIEDLKKWNSNELFIILTGWRRTYVINKLNELKVKYVYHELVSTNELNELYNCLDLYIVSSRIEGGPRALLEGGIAKTPIISTNVGIAELVLPKESIYDMNNIMSYKSAKSNIDHTYKKACEYSIDNYIQTFIKKVFYEIK